MLAYSPDLKQIRTDNWVLKTADYTIWYHTELMHIQFTLTDENQELFTFSKLIYINRKQAALFNMSRIWSSFIIPDDRMQKAAIDECEMVSEETKEGSKIEERKSHRSSLRFFRSYLM